MNTIEAYRAAMQEELEHILSFWITHTIDETNGGFIGRIDHNNNFIENAPKGAVLNARILWSFAAAYNLTGNKKYLAIATRAFQYIRTHFIDRQYGGVYWLLDYKGQPLDTKKQIYALAFTLYACSEYYTATKDPDAIAEATGLYEVINQYSYDAINGGYTEAFTREWKTIADLRLSDKDANEKKSMNTNLHVLEAFTAYYRVRKHEDVKQHVAALAEVFIKHIIDPQTHHQHLFFDEQWQSRSTTISYGHDIETAWLLQEAAEVIEEEALIAKAKQVAVQMADAVKSGLDKDGGLWYEYEPDQQHLVMEKHSWPQAEAMVGFFNAWQNTNDKTYLDISWNAWQFVQQHIRDKENGEWFWGVRSRQKACSYEIMQEDKMGMWKCPYHNSRACIEIIKRIQQMQRNN